MTRPPLPGLLYWTPVALACAAAFGALTLTGSVLAGLACALALFWSAWAGRGRR